MKQLAKYSIGNVFNLCSYIKQKNLRRGKRGDTRGLIYPIKEVG